jgi:hypothetical protein
MGELVYPVLERSRLCKAGLIVPEVHKGCDPVGDPHVPEKMNLLRIFLYPEQFSSFFRVLDGG